MLALVGPVPVPGSADLLNLSFAYVAGTRAENTVLTDHELACADGRWGCCCVCPAEYNHEGAPQACNDRQDDCGGTE